MKTVPLKVKVCGLRNKTNILDVDKLKPDYLGFIFYPPSTRNMDKDFDQVPDTKTTRVGVFVNECIETMIKKTRDYKIKTIQLHGNESPEICAELKSLGYEIFKTIKVDDYTSTAELELYIGTCDAFLFDTRGKLAGGTGIKFNWKKLDELATVGPFIISGGIGFDDINAIKKLDYPNLIGVDVNSKFEISPGLKNIDLLKTFINSVKNR